MNLLPHLQDRTEIARASVFGEGFAHDIADISTPEASLLYRWCISDRWKLIVPHGKEPTELYDVVADRWEKKNLAADSAAKVKELRGKLDGWWKPE